MIKSTSTIYYILIYVFPPRETFIEHAVHPEIYDSSDTIEGVSAGDDRGISDSGEEGTYTEEAT